ncbi:hypothetical protein DL765_002327 [Monosporascus sp. GIB2]|nr:hypothetical protein DL765_002327 [Monosporascus sp. GIB2]
MLEDFINGQLRTALADSGAKGLVMGEAYARSIGASIHNGHNHRTRLKFADNSTANTSGTAYGIERFRRNGEFAPAFWLNFRILKNTPANVILCDTFLLDNEASSRYHNDLVDNEDDYQDEDDRSFCFLVDVNKKRNPIQTTATATAFSLADLQYLELVRRGEEEDRISALPVDEQEAAQNIENRRCDEWDQKFEALQANSQAQSLQQPSTTGISQPQSIQPAQSRATGPQSSDSSLTSRSRIWKWPGWRRRKQATTSARQ